MPVRYGRRLMVGVVAGCICLVGLWCIAVGMRALAIARQATLPPASTIVWEPDIQYGTGGGKPLLLDLARPRNGNGPFPGIVCIHGGGWKAGDRKSFKSFTELMARRGYVAATVQYRFAPAYPFPAQVEDVKCAVRYLRANAKRLRLDPKHIGAMGGSAGAHLALMMGATEKADGLEGSGGNAGFSSEVQAVGSIAGPTDLTRAFPRQSVQLLEEFTGGPRSELPRVYERASPIRYLDRGDPPILAIQGTADTLVPYEQATLLIDACKKTGVKARLITIRNGGHGGGGNPADWQKANEKLVAFLDKNLKPSPR